MTPAYQRFHTADVAGHQIHLGLESQFQLIVIHRRGQLLFQHLGLTDFLIHVGDIKLIAVATLGLGQLHDVLGVFHQLFCGGGVMGVHGDTDGGRYLDGMAVEAERAPHTVQNPLRHVGSLIVILQAGQDDGKHVAAYPCHGLAGIKIAAKPVRQREQQLVTRMIGMQQVHRLEIIQCTVQYSEHVVLDVGFLNRLLDPPQQQIAVGQFGEHIVIAQALDVGFGHPPLAVVLFDGLEQVIDLLHPGAEFVVIMAVGGVEFVLGRAHGIDFFQRAQQAGHRPGNQALKDQIKHAAEESRLGQAADEYGATARNECGGRIRRINADFEIAIQLAGGGFGCAGGRQVAAQFQGVTEFLTEYRGDNRTVGKRLFVAKRRRQRRFTGYGNRSVKNGRVLEQTFDHLFRQRPVVKESRLGCRLLHHGENLLRVLFQINPCVARVQHDLHRTEQ